MDVTGINDCPDGADQADLIVHLYGVEEGISLERQTKSKFGDRNRSSYVEEYVAQALPAKFNVTRRCFFLSSIFD